MNWPRTPPTEPGDYYWRINKKAKWSIRTLYSIDGKLQHLHDFSRKYAVEEMEGEWGGPVPAPGTAFTVEQIKEWLIGVEWDGATLSDELCDPEHGIAAVTERTNK